MSRKIFFVVFVSLVGIVISAGYLYTQNTPHALVSPFTSGKDQTEKISQKVFVTAPLHASTSKELASLARVPRYIVFNQDTSKVYYSKGADLKTSPASFTKLLSAQVALDLVSLDADIEVLHRSLDKVPTVLGLKAGEVLTVSDLLRGSIATSANDAAQVLADGAASNVDISPAEFIYYMNKKATLLGMHHSHFTNPDGLDDQNQYSTLLDIALLVRNVQKNYPEILAAAISDNDDILASSTHGHYYLPNWNGLLGVYPGVDGLKIAYTGEAGYSTIVTAKREDVQVIAIISGTDSYLERDRAAADLLDAAFLAEGLPPKKITTAQLNQRYKIWGDLARKIRAELSALESVN